MKRLPLKARMAEIQKDLKAATGDRQTALLQEKNRIVRQMAALG